MLRRTLLALSLLSAAAAAQALEVGGRVDNFRLLDHEGRSHELYYLSDMKAVVLMTHESGCKSATESVASLNSINREYSAQGVTVLMLDSKLADTRDVVAKDLANSGNGVPVLLDSLQLIGESLDVKQTGEALVIDPKEWKLVYRGPVDGVPGALNAVQSGGTVAPAAKHAKGCKIDLPEAHRERAHERISYERTIAPMLMDKCVKCHREGGIGPWQMTSYEIVRGFAPMMREVLRTERMPPWHADPHYGVFSNNRSLSAEETKTLVHWIEAGAPRGKGSDPLATVTKSPTNWQLGKPDLVLEIPAFAVPATGAIPYQRPIVKNTIGHDVWLKAIEFAPTNRSLVHHILAGTTGGHPQSELAGLEQLTSLGVYVPGDVPHDLPRDTGVLITKDSNFIFQVHYTANGKAASEVTRVALYFENAPPKYPLRNTVFIDTDLKIPANTKAHTVSLSRTFDRDVLIYTLMPHAHVRGDAAEYTVKYPDGQEEVLLSVPKYDFNWQTTYELKTPKLIPKGSVVTYSTTYDNSTQNKANPDPNIEVRWGEQTWEEMLYGDVRFRYPDEVVTSSQLTSG